MSRDVYEQQLRGLEADILRLGSLVEQAISDSIEALKQQDVAGAQQVIRDDDEIDRAQYELEDKALRLIATQGPVACDVRTISAAISIASELERMGDYAEGIAEITMRIGSTPLPKPLIDIPHMAVLAQEMLRAALDAYTRKDRSAAEGLGRADDAVDQITERVQHELLTMMVNDPSYIEVATYLLYIVHNLERIADRATNIGERVIFMVTGQIIDLNE